MPHTATLTIAVFSESSGWSLPSQLIDQIAEVNADVRVRAVDSRAELLAILPETQYLVGFPLSDDDFHRHGQSLKWIQLTSTTPDLRLELPWLAASSVRVSTASTIQASQRAEHAVMLILALVRRLNEAITAQLEHVWASNDLSKSIADLEGMTVGIVGLGPLGRAIAKRLRPFDVEILATLGDADNPFGGVDEMLPLDRLDELLGRSDVVVLAVPPMAVRGVLLNRSMLENCQKSALLVNVSHNRVCDDMALAEMLSRRRLAGAGLDSFDSAPLPESSPLWRMSNVLITPRVASVSPRYWERATSIVCENLQRLLEGRSLIDEWTAESGREQTAPPAAPAPAVESTTT
jgi:D-3-phosphoglycerate dehydrogenase